MCTGLSVPGDEPPDGGTRTNLLFTMSYRTGSRPKPAANLFHANDRIPSSLHRIWWSRTGSNRRPPACKAGALPAELRPLIPVERMVGLGGLEPPTSRLSSARSNQLSYKPSDPAPAPSRQRLARPTGRRGLCRALAERQHRKMRAARERRSKSFAKKEKRRGQIPLWYARPQS